MRETTFKSAQSRDWTTFANDLLEQTCENEFAQAFYGQLKNHKSFNLLDQFLDSSTAYKPFLHKSFLNQSKLSLEDSRSLIASNEKLEFLGDSVLGLFISEYLYENFTHLSEGEMSKFRAFLVNSEKLMKLAKAIELESLFIMGKGEIKTKVNQNENALCDLFEAILGHIFLEQGIANAKLFLSKVIEHYEIESGSEYFADDFDDQFDFKSKLQEEVVKIYKELPEYRFKETENESFEVTISFAGKVFGPVVSESKKKAQKTLAKKIIEEKLYVNN